MIDERTLILLALEHSGEQIGELAAELLLTRSVAVAACRMYSPTCTNHKALQIVDEMVGRMRASLPERIAEALGGGGDS